MVVQSETIDFGLFSGNTTIMPKVIYAEEIKQRALELRKQGYTHSELQKLLKYPIPKNTFTGWFKNIVLSEQAKDRIIDRIRKGGAPGRAIAWQNTTRRRAELIERIYQQVDSEIKNIDQTMAKLCLAMLYLGEGAKSRETFRFGNSDPKVIQLFLKLLRQAFLINDQKLRCHVQCRADQDVKTLEIFWSQVSSIPLSQFRKPLIDLRTRGKPTRRLDYKGVFVVEYYSNLLFLEVKFLSDIIYKRLKLGP